ncbi:hypothetical protein SCOR_12265 [Sulfidibacter corallicola]|uniref:Uncharacterized protein n=1 Tax=Sulfidibacter corallicola TaxID=2818388 RepID=A0A8A4TMS5_SULCO|nr:hypothetical protein [Sulfidibacter corallicola]QTD47895.1 hypothetical protein J3U87_20105 [Sulfidibacter corallicola]
MIQKCPAHPEPRSLDALTDHIGETGRRRRQVLIDRMAHLEHEGLHCFSCSGVCCTFVANSMQTTPLETVEIIRYLKRAGRLDAELIERLRETVRRYRLDAPSPGDGRRHFVRRTYTCPFFMGQARGCSLSRTIKPYGCLGFNPHRPDQTEGGDCASDTTALTLREARSAELETAHNQWLRARLELDWEKKPMPVALLDILERLAGVPQ